MSTLIFSRIPSFFEVSNGGSNSIISVSTSSAMLSAAEAPRDKFHPTESGAGWFSSFLRLIMFGIVLAGVWYGWKMYGHRYFRLGNNSGAFGRGGGGLIWSDGKRF